MLTIKLNVDEGYITSYKVVNGAPNVSLAKFKAQGSFDGFRQRLDSFLREQGWTITSENTIDTSGIGVRAGSLTIQYMIAKNR